MAVTAQNEINTVSPKYADEVIGRMFTSSASESGIMRAHGVMRMMPVGNDPVFIGVIIQVLLYLRNLRSCGIIQAENFVFRPYESAIRN